MKKFPIYLFASVISLLLIASIMYSWQWHEQIEREPLRLKSNGEVEGIAPFPPSLQNPLGTDGAGQDMMWRLIDGFKYTFLLLLFILIIRFLFGGLLAYLLTFPLKRVKEWIQVIFLPFHYIPGFILVLMLIPNRLIQTKQLDYWNMVLFQLIAVSIIGLPVLINALMNEMENTLKNEYIEAAYVLGANHIRTLIKHVLPVLKKRLFIIGLQQLSMSFLLLIHLAVFEWYIGGQSKLNMGSEDNPKLLSQNGEWAALIGQGKDFLLSKPWLFFGPMLAAVLFFIGLNIVMSSLKEPQNK